MLTEEKKDHESHNPKVGGSNPPPSMWEAQVSRMVCYAKCPGAGVNAIA